MTEEATPEVIQEVTDWKDKYFRTLAEMENMRKRMQKDRQEMIRFGIENAISEFLPAIDNLENALRFANEASGEVKNWAVGFEMILSLFKEILHNHGIVSFHSEGNTFDPLSHEAVEVNETTDHPDGMILHEFTKGYKSASRTIRPARVKVAKHPQKEEPSQINAEEKKEEELTQNN
jgi:molecular chaperone GrpE